MRIPSKTPPLVLVVDDEASMRSFLARLLRTNEFAVTTAGTVMGAIASVSQQRIDAVILDLTLGPDESGLDVLGWLRAQPQYTDLPILILTGDTTLPEDEQVVIRKNHAYVFYKPKNIDDLIPYLKRLTET